ncbi:hypothetical protein BDR07DRAFT_1384650 [Suillus spraguei]|nr:hypothetical protein BDR07DRAFT_1384650 [Suillus spraguei]
MTVTPLLVTIDHVLQNALLAAVDRPHPLQHEKVTDILTAITTQPVIAAIAHPLPIMAHHQNGAILIPMSLPQRHLFLDFVTPNGMPSIPAFFHRHNGRGSQ